MKKEFNINESELKKFIEENSIEVPILMTPYKHKLVLAEPLFVKIQELSGLTVEEFQKYIDGLKSFSAYERNKLADACISNIEFPGMFKVHGYEKVGNNPYVFVHKIFEK